MGFEFSQLGEYMERGSGGSFTKIGLCTVNLGFTLLVPNHRSEEIFYPIDYELGQEGSDRAFKQALDDLRNKYGIGLTKEDDWKKPLLAVRFEIPLDKFLSGRPPKWSTDTWAQHVTVREVYEVEEEDVIKEEPVFHDIVLPSVKEHVGEENLGKALWMRIEQKEGPKRKDDPEKNKFYPYVAEVYPSREAAEAAAGSTLDESTFAANVEAPSDDEWNDMDSPWPVWRDTIAEQFDEIAAGKEFSFPLNKVQANALIKPVESDYPQLAELGKIVELYEAWHDDVVSGKREIIPF